VERTFEVAVGDVNDAPQPAMLDVTSVAESATAGTVVGTLSAADEDGDLLVFDLPLQADQQLFTVDGNLLRVVAPPGLLDFEAVAAYDITVRARDPAGLSSESIITITITDANDAPFGLALDGITVMENSALGTLVGKVSVLDQDVADVVKMQLIGGDGRFALADGLAPTCTVVPVSGLRRCTTPLTVSGSLDYELRDSYTVTIVGTDSGMSVKQQFVLTVVDANDPPSELQLTSAFVRESAVFGDVIGEVIVIDEDAGQTATCNAVGSQLFYIEDNRLKAAGQFDFEVPPLSSFSFGHPLRSSACCRVLDPLAYFNVFHCFCC